MERQSNRLNFLQSLLPRFQGEPPGSDGAVGASGIFRALTILCLSLALFSLWIHLNSMGLSPAFPWLGSAFALHLLAIPLFIGAFLRFFARLRKAPPAMRASSIRFLREGRPKWLLVLILIVLLYAIGNFLILAWIPLDSYRLSRIKEATGVDAPTLMELRAFSGHWMVFFLAAAYLMWPSKPTENRGTGSASPSPAGYDLAGPGHAAGYSRRVESRSLQSRVWAGAYGLTLAWTAFLSAVFLMAAVLSSEWFLTGPGLMFAVATYVNYRFRKKRVRYFILACEIQDSNVVIDYLDLDRRRSFQTSRENCRSILHEEVIRGNSLFALEIGASSKDAGSGLGTIGTLGDNAGTMTGTMKGTMKGNSGELIQVQCREWPYEELEAIHELLGQDRERRAG